MIRTAADGEVPAIVRLWGASKADGHTYEEDLAYFRANIQPRCELWVFEENGVLLGYLAVHESMIDRLYVHPDAQRRGVGTALLHHAMARAPGGLELYTLVSNRAARAFYERFGFRAVEFGTSPPPENEPDVRYRWDPS